MAGANKVPDHTQWMGRLVVNLQSLEFALRGFLYNYETKGMNQGGPNFLENIEEGQQLEENAFTNYDTLRELIEDYNSKVQSSDRSLAIDPDIARIRDALAHGRIAGLSPSLDEPLRLVKYSKPANGRVYVTDYHILTRDWFDEKSRAVMENIRKVTRANALLQQQAP